MKKYQEYLQKAIENAPNADVAARLRALLPQASALSGGGGPTNPTQPGRPPQ